MLESTNSSIRRWRVQLLPQEELQFGAWEHAIKKSGEPEVSSYN